MPISTRENPITPSSQNALKFWILASRPKTWIASISPVLIGGILAKEHFDPFLFSIALLFALSLQIGCNFANDYFDFLKGADTESRVGPARAMQQGLISFSAMKRGLFITFTLACFLGTFLAVHVGAWSLPIVLLATLSAWFYTAGKKPLGYLGLGEILVLLFFGPVALFGTYFLLTHSWNSSVFLSGFSFGFLSCAILTANNLRDCDTDRAAGKKTLIARFGKRFGRFEFAFFLLAPLLLSAILGSNLPLLLLPFAAFLIRIAFRAEKAEQFVPLLGLSVLFLAAYTILYAC